MNESKLKDLGHLILRVGLGSMMILHGWPKISGGTEMWENVGKTMSQFGITFMPVFWGFCAAFAEFFGGLGVVLGFFFRPACVLVIMVLLTAFTSSVMQGKGFSGWGHPAEMGIAFIALLLMGKGKYSIR